MQPTEPTWSRRFEPPYYAVIFTSKRTSTIDSDRYGESYEVAAAEMEATARQQPGFLGIESYRNDEGVGVTISYWRSEKEIQQWGQQARHLLAQDAGRSDWYQGYTLRVARVERESSFKL